MNNTEEPVLVMKNVSKTFYLRENNSSIRDRFFSIFKQESKKTEIKALNNIDLQLFPGETLGIIGRNGSGKSTLIHLIMKSLMPDDGGTVSTKGKLIRLALGLGIDPNLSARDNIYVNGSILGLSFKKIGRVFNEIIDFSGLHDFIDIPLKKYSKGMKQRLMFSIAIHADADLFLLDEFFGGTGDQEFKAKSDKAFQDIILKNNSIIIVSHSMHIIKKYCDRCIWLHHGKVYLEGDVMSVTEEYIKSFKQ